MKKTIIIYPQGCYGSFIAWLLENSNTPIEEIQLPFQSSGSAHNAFTKIHQLMKSDIKNLEYFLTSSDYNILQFHCSGDTKDLDALVSMFINYKKYNIVVIGFNYQSKIWVLNNIKDKTFNHFMQSNDFLSALSLWGNPPHNDWQIRECLSCYTHVYEPQLDEQLKIIQNIVNNHTQNAIGFYFDIEELRDNFENTIKQLCSFCSFEYSNDTIDYIKTQWFLSQKHLYTDSIVNTITNNIIDNKDFVITDQLSLIDEAYVQHKLRDRGIELKCYNLNKFPSTSAEFQPLLSYNFDTLITNNFNSIIKKVYNKQLSHDDALSQISNILKKLDD